MYVPPHMRGASSYVVAPTPVTYQQQPQPGQQSVQGQQQQAYHFDPSQQQQQQQQQIPQLGQYLQQGQAGRVMAPPGLHPQHQAQQQQVPQQQRMPYQQQAQPMFGAQQQPPAHHHHHHHQQHQHQQQQQYQQGAQQQQGYAKSYMPPHQRTNYQPTQHTNNNTNNAFGAFGGYVPRPRFNLATDEAEVLQLFETTGVSKGINFSDYENIPVSVHPQGRVDPIQSFRDVRLPKELDDNIQRCGYDQPTPVQKYCIPMGLRDFDIMACAQTGSGKTAAFLLPVIAKILRNPPEASPTYGVVFTQCVVMAPTRELAIQIHIEARKFCFRTRLRAAVLYGGADIRGQLHALNAGGDIVIATPGRLWDVHQRGKVKFQNVKCLVLDEADRMLDMGFEPQIRQIVQSRESDMPQRDARQTLMFSATFPREIQTLAQEFLSRTFLHLTVGRIGSTTQSIVQTVGWVEEHEKFDALVDVLSNQPENDLTLVFAETKRGVEDVARKLARAGFPAVSIHGDKAQNEREAALLAFKSGAKPILVATDVASRGLDIPNVMTVVQYDLPHHVDEYVHRIGRTGLVGNEGEAISFFSQKNVGMAKELIEILTEAQQTVPDFLYEAVDAAAFQHQQKQWNRKAAGRGRGAFQRQRGGAGGRGAYGGHHHHQQHHHGHHHGHQHHHQSHGGGFQSGAPWGGAGGSGNYHAPTTQGATGGDGGTGHYNAGGGGHGGFGGNSTTNFYY